MSKKRKISKLVEKISWDIEKVNVMLEIITEGRIENVIEAQILARFAFETGREIDKNNQKIEEVLDSFGKPKKKKTIINIGQAFPPEIQNTPPNFLSP